MRIKAETLINKPLVDLDKITSRLTSAQKQELERAMDAYAIKAARIAGYLGARGADGCGDCGHDGAVRASNHNAAKVRKALGYTYARDDVRF